MGKMFNIEVFDKKIEISNNIICFAEFRNKVYKICFDKSNELRNRYYAIRKNVTLNDRDMIKNFKEISYGFIEKYEEIYHDIYTLLINEYNCDNINYNDFLNNVQIINDTINRNLVKITNEKSYDRNKFLSNMKDEFTSGSIKSTVLGVSGNPFFGSATAAMSSMRIEAELNRYLYEMNKNFVDGYDLAIEAYVDMGYELSFYLSMFAYIYVDASCLKEINEKGCNFVYALQEYDKYKVIKDEEKKKEYLIKIFELNLFDCKIIEEIIKINTASNIELIKWLLFINEYDWITYLTNDNKIVNKFDNNTKELSEYFYKDAYEIVSNKFEEEKIFYIIYNIISDKIINKIDLLHDFSIDDISIVHEDLENKISLLETLFNKEYIKKYVIYNNKDVYEVLDEFEKLKKKSQRFINFFSWYFKLSIGITLLLLNYVLIFGEPEFMAYIIFIPLNFIYVYKMIKTKIWFKNYSASIYKQIKVKR